MTRLCMFRGCDRPACHRNWCKRHYNTLKKAGRIATRSYNKRDGAPVGMDCLECGRLLRDHALSERCLPFTIQGGSGHGRLVGVEI